MTDSARSILASAGRFFSGTMLSRISGMGRDMMMAYAFGATASTAAFMVAFRLAHLLRRVFGEGALQSAFTPHYEELRQKSPDRAGQFFRDLNGTMTVTLLGVIVLLSLLLGMVLQLPLSPGNQEIVSLTLFMLPGLLFICLYGLNTSLLQCHKHYFTPAAAPIAFNLIWIGGAYALMDSPHAMTGLALIVTLGCAAQWMATLPQAIAVWRSCARAVLFSSDVRSLLKPISLGIAGIAATQFNTAVDALFARYAELEGPAFLWYASRLQQLPLALFGIALSGALLPPLSRAIKSGNHARFQQLFTFGIRQSLLVMVPVTCGIILLGYLVINLIYGHGDFSVQDVSGTYWCLAGYAAGLVPMTLIMVLAPACFAQGDYRTPARASLLSVGANLILNTFMITVMQWGAASIALSTSLSAGLNAYLLWEKPNLSNYFPAIGKALLASICGIILVAFSDFPLTGTSREIKGQVIAFAIPALLYMVPVGWLWFSETLQVKKEFELVP